MKSVDNPTNKNRNSGENDTEFLARLVNSGFDRIESRMDRFEERMDRFESKLDTHLSILADHETRITNLENV